jgi:hypothetical protein
LTVRIWKRYFEQPLATGFPKEIGDVRPIHRVLAQQSVGLYGPQPIPTEGTVQILAYAALTLILDSRKILNLQATATFILSVKYSVKRMRTHGRMRGLPFEMT